LRLTVTVAVPPGQIVPPPVTVAIIAVLTVTVALPTAPAIEQPMESITEDTEYVVVADGRTMRVSGLDPVAVAPPLLSATV
jgi:hypothetical protein